MEKRWRYAERTSLRRSVLCKLNYSENKERRQKSGPECCASACVQSAQEIWEQGSKKKIQSCRGSRKEDSLRCAPASSRHGYASRHVWVDADILRHATAEPPHRLPRKLPGSTCAQGPSALTATGRTPVFDEKNTTSRKQDVEEGIKSVT